MIRKGQIIDQYGDVFYPETDVEDVKNIAEVAKTGSYNDLSDKLVAGENISITEGNVISALLDGRGDSVIAGEGILVDKDEEKGEAVVSADFTKIVKPFKLGAGLVWDNEFDVIAPLTPLDSDMTYIVGKDGVSTDIEPSKSKWANSIIERDFADEEIEDICVSKLKVGAGVVIDLTELPAGSQQILVNSGITIERHVFKITSVERDGNTYTATLGKNDKLFGVKIIGELGKRVAIKFPFDLATPGDVDVVIDPKGEIISHIGTVQELEGKILRIDGVPEMWKFATENGDVERKLIVLN